MLTGQSITWSAGDLKQFTNRQPARDSGNQIVDESVQVVAEDPCQDRKSLVQKISTAGLVGPLAERVTQLGLIAFPGRHGRCADRLVKCHTERNCQQLRYKSYFIDMLKHSLNGGRVVARSNVLPWQTEEGNGRVGDPDANDVSHVTRLLIWTLQPLCHLRFKGYHHKLIYIIISFE